MPNVTRSNGCDTRQASREHLSNAKDPPQLRRASILAGCDAAEAFMRDTQDLLKATDAYWEFEWQFASHYSHFPRDEEYYSLLNDCHQMRFVLETNPNAMPYTFLDILTSTLTRRATSIEEMNHMGEHEFSSAHLLSPCAVPHALSSTWPEAICSVPTARESLRMLSLSVDDVEEMMCASNSDAVLKQLEDLRSFEGTGHKLLPR